MWGLGKEAAYIRRLVKIKRFVHERSKAVLVDTTKSPILLIYEQRSLYTSGGSQLRLLSWGIPGLRRVHSGMQIIYAQIINGQKVSHNVVNTGFYGTALPTVVQFSITSRKTKICSLYSFGWWKGKASMNAKGKLKRVSGSMNVLSHSVEE